MLSHDLVQLDLQFLQEDQGTCHPLLLSHGHYDPRVPVVLLLPVFRHQVVVLPVCPHCLVLFLWYLPYLAHTHVGLLLQQVVPAQVALLLISWLQQVCYEQEASM